jgi:hypothetical protein
MIESCTRLDDFGSLNPIEELFSQDKMEEVKQLEMDFPPRFSEICVKFGAWKCFEYMLEKDAQNGQEPGAEGSCISWRVNLYLIKQNKKPLAYIHHPAELCFVLYYDRKEMLPLIELPSIDIAFKTMMKFIRENSFDAVDYVREIYDLYPSSSWCRHIGTRSAKTITFLLQVGKDYLLRGVKITSSTIREVVLSAPDKLETLRELCVFPIVCKSDDREVLGKMRENGLYACKSKLRARGRVTHRY